MIKHTKSYIKGHPNPQYTRTSFENLDGKWGFAFDDENKGIKERYYKEFPQEYEIEVPYSFEYPASGLEIKETHNIVWYRKKFIYKPTKNKERTLLHFEGVDYEAKVYVNGEYVGNHLGAYSRFSFDISQYINEGENEIVVRVYDDYSCTRSRGKQRWMDHNYECFYRETTGIYKSVWLEFVPQTYLKTVYIKPSYEKTNVSIEYEIEGETKGYTLETIITYNNQIINQSTKVLTDNKYIDAYDLTTHSATMKLHCWNDTYPCLYDVEFNLYHEGILIDTVLSYFGIAEFISRGSNIYLNRNILFPRLILDQGYYPDTGISLTEQQMIQDITLMKEIGLNGCRKHQKIESDLFYYYCDVMGFYLWQELPSAYEWKMQTIKNLSNEWTDILLQHLNHPCIMAHVIVNESWGTMAIGTNKNQQYFTLGLYNLTKSIDENHFVISNDGWEHTISDLITVHDYSSEKQLMDEAYKDFNNHFLIDDRLARVHSKRLFDDGFINHELKPILMTEFAGIAFSKDQNIGWGYGDLVPNEEKYLERLKGQIDSIIESHVFTGFCITQLSDVQQEVNGLVDENRNFKVDKLALKNIITKKF